MLKGYLQGITTALWDLEIFGESQILADIWLSCYMLNLGQLGPAIPVSGQIRGLRR